MQQKKGLTDDKGDYGAWNDSQRWHPQDLYIMERDDFTERLSYLGDLPFEVRAIGVMPHMHQLGRRIRADLLRGVLLGRWSRVHADATSHMRGSARPAEMEGAEFGPEFGYYGAIATHGFGARRHMHEYGTTREQFGAIALAFREHALRNPEAAMKKPLTMEDYLTARPIANPIALFDCVMPVAGAEAFLVMTEDEAVRRNLPFARIAGAIERHNAHVDDPIQLRGGWTIDRDELWDMAACAPADMDLVQTYDDYPVISMMQIEDLGFCDKGAAPDFLRDRDLTTEGDFPHNTSGGQLSAGQAGAAGGFIGLVEAIRQVTGQAGPTQVRGARRALVSGFGMINYDRGLCTGAAVLEAA